MYIKTFNEISQKDINQVGGKGASLGEMIQAGISVPSGFVITTQVYQNFINEQLPVEVREEILKAFNSLGEERVAVRSSAVAEDSTQASLAGQLETFLNVKKEDLIDSVRDCWNSIKSDRALAYIAQQNLAQDKLAVAVVVQKMIDSKSSGVAFTANPITKNTNEIMIEAGFGLGEALVQGLITPDNLLLNKKTLEIENRDIQIQETMLAFIDGENREVAVPDDKKDKPAIPDDKVVELAKLAIQIENHYQAPQDIEWAIDNQGKIWILQSRPITTLQK
jgi:pyruvate,water dikinase